jgi:hypothetical protein
MESIEVLKLYLAIGFLVAAFLMILALIIKTTVCTTIKINKFYKSKSKSDFFDVLWFDTIETLKEIGSSLCALLAITVMVIAWPVTVCFVIYQWIRETRDKIRFEIKNGEK